MKSLIVVNAAYDAAARVSIVETSDLAGLNLEAPTLDELQSKPPPAVIDLLDASGEVIGDFDIPIEIVAHAIARAQAF